MRNPINSEKRASGLSRLADLYLRHRFACLFFSLLLTIGAEPLLRSVFSVSSGLFGLLTLNLIAIIFGMFPYRYASAAVLLAAAFVALRAVHGEAWNAVADLAWMTVCVPAAAMAVRYALRPGEIDAERVLAALDGYLIAGIVFGLAYFRIETLWPGSFAKSLPGPMTPADSIYFSFVTLVTLGYGDIVPATDAVRGLVLLEALGGHFYVVVLVARLVSLFTTARALPPRS
jgi:voltage-gated potassium channel Kch